MDKYSRVKLLGKGTFGKAWKVRSAEGGKDYVAKEIKCENKRDLRDALSEADVLSKLSHPHIISYYRVIQSSPKLVTIIMEYCGGGDIGEKIARRKFRSQYFEESTLQLWTFQAADALSYLHKRGILHRDVKPANFFLTGHGLVKLGDFGIARVLDRNAILPTERTTKTPVGTPMYFSPEMCSGKRYGQKADVWALGCVVYEIASLRPAFTAFNLESLTAKIKRGHHDKYLPVRYGHGLRKLIAQLLVVDVTRRLTAEEILRSDYLAIARLEDQRLLHSLKDTEPHRESTLSRSDVCNKASEMQDHKPDILSVHVLPVGNIKKKEHYGKASPLGGKPINRRGRQLTPLNFGGLYNAKDTKDERHRKALNKSQPRVFDVVGQRSPMAKAIPPDFVENVDESDHVQREEAHHINADYHCNELRLPLHSRDDNSNVRHAQHNVNVRRKVCQHSEDFQNICQMNIHNGNDGGNDDEDDWPELERDCNQLQNLLAHRDLEVIEGAEHPSQVPGSRSRSNSPPIHRLLQLSSELRISSSRRASGYASSRSSSGDGNRQQPINEKQSHPKHFHDPLHPAGGYLAIHKNRIPHADRRRRFANDSDNYHGTDAHGFDHPHRQLPRKIRDKHTSATPSSPNEHQRYSPSRLNLALRSQSECDVLNNQNPAHLHNKHQEEEQQHAQAGMPIANPYLKNMRNLHQRRHSFDLPLIHQNKVSGQSAAIERPRYAIGKQNYVSHEQSRYDIRSKGRFM